MFQKIHHGMNFIWNTVAKESHSGIHTVMEHDFVYHSGL